MLAGPWGLRRQCQREPSKTVTVLFFLTSHPGVKLAGREGFRTARQSKGRPKATGLFSTDASDRAV
jgi:hypothetical protein